MYNRLGQHRSFGSVYCIHELAQQRPRLWLVLGYCTIPVVRASPTKKWGLKKRPAGQNPWEICKVTKLWSFPLKVYFGHISFRKKQQVEKVMETWMWTRAVIYVTISPRHWWPRQLWTTRCFPGIHTIKKEHPNTGKLFFKVYSQSFCMLDCCFPFTLV